MRLGYLVPEFPGQTHAFFWREVQALRGAGVEVHLLSTRRPEPGACAHAFAEAARAETTYLFPPAPERWPASALARVFSPGVRSYFAELPERGPASLARQTGILASALELRAQAQRLGLQHVHVHSAANAAHVASLAHLLGGPTYSLTLHGDLDVYGTGHARKFRTAKFVSVVTRALAEAVGEQLSLPAAFLPVIRMGVDVGSFKPLPRGDSPDFRLTTVARLNHTKGHVYALEAIARLRAEGFELRYRIAGTGPEEAALRAHVARLELGDVVSLLGSLAEHEVRELLLDSDVFLLTSFGLGEAAPVSVMEAMASGCSVVCSRIGGTAEIIANGEDGLLVPQQDVGAIAEAVRSLITSKDLRNRIGSAARRRALADFDAGTNAQRLLACIEGKA